MDFMEVLKRRRSVRKFRQEKIPPEELQKLLEAARFAPVGSNRRQDIHLTVVQNPEILEKLAEAAVKRAENQALMKKLVEDVDVPRERKRLDPFYGAPAVIFISHRRQTLQPGIEDANAACVAQTLHLAACSQGLGSVLIWGVLEAMREIPELDHTGLLELPPDFEPLLGVAAGIPEIPVTERSRQPRDFSVNYLP